MLHYDYLSSDLYPVTAFFPVNREMRWQIRFFLSAGTNYICVKKLAKEIRALHPHQSFFCDRVMRGRRRQPSEES